MRVYLWVMLFGWVLGSIFLHIYSPERWGDWIHPWMPFYGKYQSVLQGCGHAILMGGFSFLLIILLRQFRLGAFMLTMGLTLLFAVAMEWMQGRLPYVYRRECDLMDLIPALAGALAGCAAGFGLSRSRE